MPILEAQIPHLWETEAWRLKTSRLYQALIETPDAFDLACGWPTGWPANEDPNVRHSLRSWLHAYNIARFGEGSADESRHLHDEDERIIAIFEGYWADVSCDRCRGHRAGLVRGSLFPGLADSTLAPASRLCRYEFCFPPQEVAAALILDCAEPADLELYNRLRAKHTEIEANRLYVRHMADRARDSRSAT